MIKRNISLTNTWNRGEQFCLYVMQICNSANPQTGVWFLSGECSDVFPSQTGAENQTSICPYRSYPVECYTEVTLALTCYLCFEKEYPYIHKDREKERKVVIWVHTSAKAMISFWPHCWLKILLLDPLTKLFYSFISSCIVAALLSPLFVMFFLVFFESFRLGGVNVVRACKVRDALSLAIISSQLTNSTDVGENVTFLVKLMNDATAPQTTETRRKQKNRQPFRDPTHKNKPRRLISYPQVRTTTYPRFHRFLANDVVLPSCF